MQVILPASTRAEMLEQPDFKPETIGDEVIKNICDTTDTSVVLALTLHSNKVSPKGLAILSLSRWDSISFLYLGTNQFGNKGCKYLSRVSFNSLDRLSLNNSQTGSTGIMHLSKAQWKCLNKIELSSNKIRAQGTKSLTQASWPKLTRIQMTGSEMKYQEVHPMILFPTILEEANLADNRLEQHEKRKMKDLMKLKIPACSFQIEK